jgi:hypothetical protein
MSKLGLTVQNSNPGRVISSPGGFSGGSVNNDLNKAKSMLKEYTDGPGKKPSKKMLDLLESHKVISKQPKAAVMPAVGKVSRLKKANRWADFSKKNLKDGIDLGSYGADAYNRATNPMQYALTDAITGGKVSRLKKANRWADFSKKNLKDGIDLGSYGADAYNRATNPMQYALTDAISGKGYQKAAGYASAGAAGPKAPSKWIQHVKAYSKAHGITYKDALKKASASYHASK